MRGWASAVLALALVGPGPPQDPSPTPRARSVFGVDADLVLVDAVVTDKKGNPVTGLTKTDFRVSEDGTVREIASFVAFGTPPQRVAQGEKPSPNDPPLPTAPSVPASTVIVIDEGHLQVMESVRLDAFFKKLLSDLTERRGGVLVLAPWSNVAYAGRLPGDIEMLTEAVAHRRGQRGPKITTYPMTDAEAFDVERGDTHALARVAARFSYLNPGLGSHVDDLVRMQATEQVAEERARRRDTFEAMRIGFAWLSKQPGRHSLLLVTSGFPYEAGDEGFNEMSNHSLRENAPVHFLDVSIPQSASAFEGVQYRYALDPRARVSPFEATDASSGSDRLAVDTGGLRVGDNDLKGLEQIIDGTRRYYVIGYEPAGRGKKGFHQIKVEVLRKGLRVRARRGYFEP